MRPDIPANEEARLANLHSYQILDSLPEKIWDELALLASQIIGTPLAAISFIDRERQWFKAVVGTHIQETPRDISFCGHTIHCEDLMLVPDTAADERFADNEWVKGEPHVRFYAGVTIKSPEGYALGSICALDKQPRSITQAQESALKALSHQITYLLTLRKTQEQLEVALDSAQRANGYKAKFLSYANHDLRAPIHAIISISDLMYRTELTAKQERLMGIITNSSASLLNIIDSFLDLSRLEAGKLELVLQPVELKPFLEGVLEPYQIQGENSQVEIIFEPGEVTTETFLFDPQRVKQILDNLLGNALKFTYQGQIKLQANVKKREGEIRLALAVADTGEGIAPEVKQTLFDTFAEGRSRANKNAGSTGLGLSICRYLVELMGGEIGVESTPGVGACFSFEIPVTV